MHLLFVCAGNLCRSPLAEGLLTAWAEKGAGRPDLPELRVGSAGIEAAVGREMDPRSARELVRLGGRPPVSTSRALTSDLASAADLILTMTRRHREAVLEMSPRGLQRTFTLREAADLLREADLAGLDDVPLDVRAREFGRRLHAQRRFRNSRASDDIEDPIGRSHGVHVRVADEIAEALKPLADTLLGWGAKRDSAATAILAPAPHPSAHEATGEEPVRRTAADRDRPPWWSPWVFGRRSGV